MLIVISSSGSGSHTINLVPDPVIIAETTPKGYLTTHLASVKIPVTFVNGPVAQLGARFNRTEEAGGSNPPRSTRVAGSINKSEILGPIAQLGARLNGIEKAGGSNPPGSTEANAGVVGHPSASREREVGARRVRRSTQTELA